MNRTHIVELESRLAQHDARTDDFKDYIDGTISQLELTIEKAQHDIRNLTGLRNALSFSTLPDYIKPEPEMPKTAELEQHEPDQMKVTLDDHELEKELADQLPESLGPEAVLKESGD